MFDPQLIKKVLHDCAKIASSNATISRKLPQSICRCRSISKTTIKLDNNFIYVLLHFIRLQHLKSIHLIQLTIKMIIMIKPHTHAHRPIQLEQSHAEQLHCVQNLQLKGARFDRTANQKKVWHTVHNPNVYYSIAQKG